MTTDIIEAARAAGVHPLAMSEEYLPGLQRFAAVFQQEIERLTLNGIHSCHAECQRPVCRLTRERNALLEALTRLMRSFPTDSDLYEARWGGHEIEEAMSAHDAAQAAIAKAEGEKNGQDRSPAAG